ncbi:hypothetical protein OG21DRAFT_917532 [Imleria badia]|nr:hypothetical protein OG21DRAFT_917532 [Imleria badia]
MVVMVVMGLLSRLVSHCHCRWRCTDSSWLQMASTVLTRSLYLFPFTLIHLLPLRVSHGWVPLHVSRCSQLLQTSPALSGVFDRRLALLILLCRTLDTSSSHTVGLFSLLLDLIHIPCQDTFQTKSTPQQRRDMHNSQYAYATRVTEAIGRGSVESSTPREAYSGESTIPVAYFCHSSSVVCRKSENRRMRRFLMRQSRLEGMVVDIELCDPRTHIM